MLSFLHPCFLFSCAFSSSHTNSKLALAAQMVCGLLVEEAVAHHLKGCRMFCDTCKTSCGISPCTGVIALCIKRLGMSFVTLLIVFLSGRLHCPHLGAMERKGGSALTLSAHTRHSSALIWGTVVARADSPVIL